MVLVVALRTVGGTGDHVGDGRWACREVLLHLNDVMKQISVHFTHK